MLICVKCKKEMLCDKNGVGADFGEGHVYPSDRFKCKTCGHLVLTTNRSSIYDPDYRTQDEYLTMDTKQETNQRYRIRYWVQETMESGYWITTDPMSEEEIDPLMKVWEEIGYMPEKIKEELNTN